MLSVPVFGRMARGARLTALVCALGGAVAVAGGELLAHPAAQERPESQTVTVPDDPSGVPVYFRGREIFRIRRGIGQASAAERAADIQTQLDTFVRPDASVGDFSLAEFPGYTEVRIRDSLLGVITDRDAEAMGLPRQLLAAQALTRLKLAVGQAQEEFTPRAILTGIVTIVVSTLILSLLLWGATGLHRRVLATLEGWRGRKLKGLRIQRVQVVTPERQAAVLSTLSRAVYMVFVVVAVVLWLQTALASLPWTLPYSRLVVAYLSAPMRFAWQAFLDYLPSLFFLAVISALTYGLLKAVHFFFAEIGRGTIRLPNFETEWAEPTYRIVRVLLIALAFVAAFPYIPGSSSPAFQGVSLFLGLLVSLSSSSAISNVIAGTILTYTGAFRIGDRVQIADTLGDVVHKSLLVTQVRTAKKVVVSIPNALVLTERILNYSTMARERGVILHSTVTIGYDAPWRTVHELLIAAAAATDGITSDPAPFVLQTALNDFYVSYEINAYTREPGRMAQIYSTLHANIQDAFNKGGVEIMSPHYSSLRDGNATTIPADHLPAEYRAPAFRFDARGSGPDQVPNR